MSDDTAAQTSDTTDTAEQQPTGQEPQQQTGTDSDKGTEATKIADLPDWAQKLIRDTRAEAAENRTKAKTATTENDKRMQAIAQALGLAEVAPDPEEVTKQLSAAQAEARERAVELAVWRSAAAHGGDAEALLDSRAFQKALADIDPTDNKAIAAAIAAAVKDNPKLAVTSPGQDSSTTASRGGSDPSGRPGQTTRPDTLTAAVEAHYATQTAR